MQQTVVWDSLTKLSCAGCSPAKVILCLPANLVAPKGCPTGAEEATSGYTWRTIEAIVTYVTASNGNGCGTVYRHTFNYDTDLIVNGSTNPLTPADILGAVCQGCLTDWVKEVAGNEVSIETDEGGNQTLITQHGCRFQLAASSGGVTLEIRDNGDQSYDILLNGSAIPGGPIYTHTNP